MMARIFRTCFAFLWISTISARTALAQQPAAWTDTTTPFRVIDNVYYVGSAGLSSWLITSPSGHILLDAGVPGNAAMVQRNIQTLGFALKDVKILLNSHAHFDHAGGLAEMKRVTGARLFAHGGDRAALERGVYVGSEEEARFRFPPVVVDSALRDGDLVSLGGVTLTANLTAGHTAGCTSWTMPVMDAGVRHTAVFFCSASVAANRLAPRPQYPGIVADYQRTFAKFRTMRADVFFAAHTELFQLPEKRARLGQRGANPFVDAGALQRVTEAMAADFQAALKQQQSGR
jgi:metallo-beta-lactamase class B